MKYNQLGRTGVLLSELCLGTMTFGGRGYWTAIGQLSQDEVDQLVIRWSPLAGGFFSGKFTLNNQMAGDNRRDKRVLIRF